MHTVARHPALVVHAGRGVHRPATRRIHHIIKIKHLTGDRENRVAPRRTGHIIERIDCKTGSVLVVGPGKRAEVEHGSVLIKERVRD